MGFAAGRMWGMRLPQPWNSVSFPCTFTVLVSLSFFFTSIVAAQGQRSATQAVQLVANPSSLNFGNIQVGSTASLTGTLTNVGKDNLTIYNDLISGTGFSMSGITLPLTFTPGQSYTLTISFSPTSSGGVSGTASFGSKSWRKLISVTLSGSGTPSGQLTVSPGTANFGNVNVGTSAQMSGTVTATGESVTISSVDSSNAQFVLSGLTLPVTLSAGQSAGFALTFTPQSTGSVTGTFSFANTAPGSPVVEALTGSGASTQHSVSLTWKPSTSVVVGYNVYRSLVSGGPYTQINGTLDSATAYTDSSVNSSTTYYYVTTAVDSTGTESAYSNEVNAAIP